MAVVALSLAAENGALFEQLQSMLHDKDVEVRLAVVAGLQELKTKPAIAALHYGARRPRAGSELRGGEGAVGA